MKFPTIGKCALAALVCTAALGVTTVSAQTLSSNGTGTNNGFYYTFWKDSGNATMTLGAAGRYTSQWTNNTNNWVGGKGWNPGNSTRVVSYSGNYGVSASQNSYLAFYGWTKSPLIEYYVIESYGSYNPASCSGGTDYGSFQSDGASYNVRRCQRVNQPSIEGNSSTFYQYFSVRNPKKGFGNISGTITFANHANFWASKGLNLGNHDYQVLATEGYQSMGSSDITVSQGTSGGTTSSTPVVASSSSSSSVASGGGNTGSGVVVRARGVAGGEHINLRIGGNVVADWNLTNSFQDLTYTGTAAGDIQVQFDNDGGSRDVVVDYIRVNGETRQAEDMEYNTGLYANGSCGGGGNSELMHCAGAIGFGYTYDCFSGNCSGGSTGGGATSSVGGSSSGGNANCSGYVGITFDDGPGNNSTTLINLLKQNNLTPVTWFVQGNYMASNSNLISQLLSVGEVQNHSYTHPHLINLSYQQIYDELNRTNQAIQSAGAPKPTLFRPPYGETNANVNQAAQALGLRVITWNVDSQDWNGASATAIANAANQLQNGQVILMHDANYNNTNAAIAQIAANLRAKGLCPGRIDAATGRAVAPAGGIVASSSRSSTPVAASSSSRSSTPVVASSSSRSSVSAGGQCQCNWWGTLYPTCQNTASGWGWENSRSCITTSTCNSQGAGGGREICN